MFKINSQIFVLFLLMITISTKAQQTVFNVPTADVLDKGKVYIELDAAFKFNNHESLQKFSGFVPRAVIGIGANTEIGLNLTGNINSGADSTAIVPTIKYRFYQNKNKDIVLFGGNNFYIPVKNRGYKFGTHSYFAIAKTIKKTRLTAGGFLATKNIFSPNAVRSGGLFAFEQIINDKLTLAADWFSGKHSNGYLTPGVIYKPHPKVTAYLSYSIGNADASKGNHYFLFELGYNF